jgi:hypothetical protein
MKHSDAGLSILGKVFGLVKSVRLGQENFQPHRFICGQIS